MAWMSMDVAFVVVVEQHYANHVSVDAIFSTRAKAEAHVANHYCSNDCHIYEFVVDPTSHHSTRST